VKMKNQEKGKKEIVVKVADQEQVAKRNQDSAGETMEAREKTEEKAKKKDETAESEVDKAKTDEEKEIKETESQQRKIERAQKEIESAPDDTSWQKAKTAKEDAEAAAREVATKEKGAKGKLEETSQEREKTLSAEKDAKNNFQGSVADEASAKSKIEKLKTKETEAKAAVREAEEAAAEALKEEEKHKAQIKEHNQKELLEKDKMEKRIKEVEAEKTKKEGNAKEMVKEKEEKAKERKIKATEVTAKAVEKQVKEVEAEKLVKEGKKKALWAEQAAKEKKVKEAETKEKKKKADCAAKQELEQTQIRFTLAEDREIEMAHGWMNFANSYEGLRLQKQGNLCVLSGLIRENQETISEGMDKGKKFWHAMETLIQTGESSLSSAPATWGKLATIGAQCRPETEIELLANNHAEVSKITISHEGVVAWKSGGSRHGWISLSGIVWKAGGHLDGVLQGNSIATVSQGNVVFANGWKGDGVAVYKQGNMCFVLGQTHSGRNFQGRVLTLPIMCRPKRLMSFAFAHGKETFRVDVDVDGAVVPYKIPDDVEKYLNLQSIAFPVVDGEEIKLHDDRGWRPSTKFPVPQAYRQGGFCVLSGVAYNGEIRAGTHSLLKNSGSPGKLPEWCLPRHRMAFTTISSEGKASRVDILDDGSIRWIAGAREKYMNLVGIRFEVRADIVQKFSESLLKVSKCE